MTAATIPSIIQGGMGVGVSDWRLARAVSMCGQLGVVSGTALDTVMVRRLQDGDAGGHLRRAFEAFPVPSVAAEVLKRYFKPEGRGEGEPYKLLSMYRKTVDSFRDQITVLANFAEVYLAKEEHEGQVGINFLTKIQMPTLASLYGAMLAGVDYVLMGAGIPREIPGCIDRLAAHLPASLRLVLEGSGRQEPPECSFEPAGMWAQEPPALKRPRFLAIIASNSLATMLARKSTGKVDGFVVESPTAGGHNAPPRGKTELNERGEPVYGARDEVDFGALSELGLPFWVAGGAGRPGELRKAREAGGAGIQVGTLFAYCEESGLTSDVKSRVIERCLNGGADVFTDATASPTGFPFKTVPLEGSVAIPEVYEKRERLCDLGYLRNAVIDENGRVDYRCAAEPVSTYVRKGGTEEETEGRRCLCNSLMASIGLGQVRKDGYEEPPLVTSGDDLRRMGEFLNGRRSYRASDVISYLLS